MVRNYRPVTNLFGCDVALFERYFGVKAKGTEEPGSGVAHMLVLIVCPHDLFIGTRGAELELEEETCCGAESPAAAAEQDENTGQVDTQLEGA
jgi:hypothetical protein